VSWTAAVLLGVVQGLTEFLPVSSSAHLIIARMFFNWQADPLVLELFDLAGHVGTLVAVIAFFWTDIVGMLRALPQALTAKPGADGRRIQRIAIGTIPIVIVGGLWGRRLEESVRTPAVAAALLGIGGVLLLIVERIGRHTKREADLTPVSALTIGVAQAAALVPGVSRSGVTIGTGLWLGFERETIARFSFLLSIPAIVAAAAKGALDAHHEHVVLTSADLQLFAIGAVTSAIVGYLTVRFFLRYLVAHTLDVFAWYRIGVAAVTFIWLATR
jgi:undecaprenyl-diphosphatase